MVANILAFLNTPVVQRAHIASLSSLDQARLALLEAEVPLPSWADVLRGVRPAQPAGEDEEDGGFADPGNGSTDGSFSQL